MLLRTVMLAIAGAVGTATLLPLAGHATPPPMSIGGLQVGLKLERACEIVSEDVGPAPVQPAASNFEALESLLAGTELEGYAAEGFGCESPRQGVVVLADTQKQVRLIQITPEGLNRLKKAGLAADPEEFPQAVTDMLPLTLDDFRRQGLSLGLTYRGSGWSVTLGNDYLLYYLHDTGSPRP